MQASPKPHAAAVASAKSLVTEQSLGRDVEFLCSEHCSGRGHGQKGSSEAAMFICRRFRDLGLQPVTPGATYSLSRTHEGRRMHDIMGMVPANTPAGRGRYIIVMAHYDGLGVIDGIPYPGADSNASGVAAMLSLARMFADVAACSTLDHNLIFVALDGKQLSFAGAYILRDALASGALKDPQTHTAIRLSDISTVVNLDILGGTSAPVRQGQGEYIIMLGGTSDQRGWFEYVSRYSGIKIQASYDYYGSRGFTRLFLDKVSDQKPFRERGVPSVMFTSGITLDTNKESDTPDKLDYGVLLRRTRAIYHWIDRLTYLL